MSPYARAVVMVAVLLAAGAIAAENTPARPEGSEALLQADRDFAKATAERRLEGWMAYFAEDGVQLGGKLAVGRDAIRAAFEPLFANPTFRLEWAPIKAGILPSGDLGYTEGRSTSYRTGPKGETVVRHGSYITVWKKQADGKWKVVFDTGAPDPEKK